MEIKRGTTPVLALRFRGLDRDAAVEEVEFLFKQECGGSARELVRKSWPGEVRRTEQGVYRVPLTQEETRRFQAGRYMYMDARILLAGGAVAAAPVAAVMVRPTLFEEAQA